MAIEYRHKGFVFGISGEPTDRGDDAKQIERMGCALARLGSAFPQLGAVRMEPVHLDDRATAGRCLVLLRGERLT